MSAHELWSEYYGQFHDQLCQFLECSFPRLADQVEDIVQTVLAEALSKPPSQSLTAQQLAVWLRVAARHRALDLLRAAECRLLVRLSQLGRQDSEQSAWEPADQRPSPSSQLAQQQRRGRQGLLLSEVLQEFCRWCEGRPDGLKMKQIYERSLRGQKPQQIAAAMGATRASVDTTLSRARQWVLRRVRQADVHRSVFLTLHRCAPADGMAEAGADWASDAKRQCPSGQGAVQAHRQPGPGSSLEIAAADVPLPQLHSFGDVVRWVIEELGAMCPSVDRLAAYLADPLSAAHADVRYHVEEAGCRLCRAENQ